VQKFTVPCGKRKLSIKIPSVVNTTIIEPNTMPIINNKRKAIREALDNPIGTKNLTQMLSGKEKVAIIVTDTTRYVPEDIIVPYLIEDLEKVGVNTDKVTIVNALGKHKPNTYEELEKMLGKEVMKKVKVVNTNPDDDRENVFLKNSENGIPIVANKYVVEADIKIATGVIEPHLFAGYSGGVKALSVGVAGNDTIKATHNANILDHPNTRQGVIENNIFRQLLNEIAFTVGLDFIVNVLQNGNKDLLDVFAGDPLKAFEAGVQKARTIYERNLNEMYDIVISVPEFPKSSDLYQATRAWNGVVFGPKPVIKKGGTIMIPAPCEKGFGQDSFYNILAKFDDPSQVEESMRKEGFAPEEDKAYIAAKVLKNYKVMITNCKIDKNMLKEMFMEPVPELQEAIDKTLTEYKNPKILIIPYGLLTLPIIN